MTLFDSNNRNVISIAHRGYSSVSPENTLISYINAKNKGFNFVECDISFTKDHKPVLLHDGSVDRTSNGKGIIEDLTLEEVKNLDFGSWFNKLYKNERIPTFEEFLILCKNLGLYPYIELKPIDNKEEIKENSLLLANILKKCGMDGKVSFISFSIDYLCEMNKLLPKERLGLISYKVDFDSDDFKRFASLKNEFNELFIDYYSKAVDDELVNNCIKYNLPLEVWVIDTIEDLKNMNPYISGVTSNTLIAGLELNKFVKR